MNRKHAIIYQTLRPLVAIFLWLKFGYTYEPAKNLPEKYIVLSNHNTDYDPLMVAVSFRKQMYFVASEHIARWKFLWPIINFLVAPIVRYKGTVAASTVMEALRRIKDGANVAIFAEGNRSWDGVTDSILPSTGKMIKSARCGLVTYKITGGYFVSPRWSQSNIRRGYIHGTPVHVYTPEQLDAMTVDQVNEAIRRDLYEDAYARQLEAPKKYKCKEPAKHMENLLFICPQCGKIDTIRSAAHTVNCTSCDMSFRYDEYGMLHGIEYQTVKELSDWQKRKVKEAAKNNAVYRAQAAVLQQVAKHEEHVIAQGAAVMCADDLTCGDIRIPLSEISDMEMHGQRALVFTARRTYYEMIIEQPDNALKFKLLYDAYREL